MFGDLGKMMKIASQMKARMPEVQAEIAAARHTAQAGGTVAATVDGKGALVDLHIDPSAIEGASGDPAGLAELVKAAVAEAQATATAAAAEKMTELTGGLDIPGLDGMLP